MLARLLVYCVFGSALTVSAYGQQYDNSGYHIEHGHKNTTPTDIPGICEHLQALVKHHEHEQAHELIIETLREDPGQPDCFFYNARLYFNHKLSGRDRHARHYFDSLMTLYDKWFAVSRHPLDVLNWKGVDVRDYFYKEPDSLRKYCALYKRIYDANKENLHPYNLKMMAFCTCDLNGKVNLDSLWQFTRSKARISHEHLWKASFKSLKREMIRCPKISCTQLNALIHPELLSNRDGTEETRQVASLLARRGCPTPAGIQLAATVDDHTSGHVPQKAETKKVEQKPKLAVAEPKILDVYERHIQVAKKNMASGKFAMAVEEYTLAVESARTPVEKADGYMGLAIASDSLKDYSKAKEYALVLHQLLPDEPDGLKFLSTLYQKAEDMCSFETAREQAAYYVLLSNISWSLANTEESDAWKENANLNELYRSGQARKGDKVHLGCFINEEVELP